LTKILHMTKKKEIVRTEKQIYLVDINENESKDAEKEVFIFI